MTKLMCAKGWVCISFAHILFDLTNVKKYCRPRRDTFGDAVGFVRSQLWMRNRRQPIELSNLLPTDITIDQGDLIRGVVKSWDEIHRTVSYLMHDNWVAYFRT